MSYQRDTAERKVHYKFAVLAQPGLYGENLETSRGRPLLLRQKKVAALAAALPEPERGKVMDTFRAIDMAHESDTTISGLLRAIAIIGAGIAVAVILSQYAHAAQCESHAFEGCTPPPPIIARWCEDYAQFNHGNFTISPITEEHCLGKMRRFGDTQATPDSKSYFRCHCEYQGSIWEKRDP